MNRTSVSRSRVLRRVACALVLVACATRVSAQEADKAAIDQLVKLENEWADAAVHRDVAMMDRLTAPRWIYSDESGVMNRSAGIKAFTTGPDTVQSATNREMHVFVYGNSAVVIGILQMSGRGAKGAFTHRYRFTDTWVLLDGRWQCVASQDYLMPAKR